MDSTRLAKALQHVQAIQSHTAYPALACRCAKQGSDVLLTRVRDAGAIPLEGLRRGQTRCRVNNPELAAHTEQEHSSERGRAGSGTVAGYLPSGMTSSKEPTRYAQIP